MHCGLVVPGELLSGLRVSLFPKAPRAHAFSSTAVLSPLSLRGPGRWGLVPGPPCWDSGAGAESGAGPTWPPAPLQRGRAGGARIAVLRTAHRGTAFGLSWTLSAAPMSTRSRRRHLPCVAGLRLSYGSIPDARAVSGLRWMDTVNPWPPVHSPHHLRTQQVFLTPEDCPQGRAEEPFLCQGPFGYL